MSIIIEFKDPLNLSEELLKLGQSTRITQFENGGGTYKISPLQYKSVSVAQIESTKLCFMRGGEMVKLLISIGLLHLAEK